MADNHNSIHCKFIDQTLITLCHKQTSNKELQFIANDLQNLGVDIFEIDRVSIEYLESINGLRNLTLAYRFDSTEIDLSVNTYHRLQSHISYGIIPWEIIENPTRIQDLLIDVDIQIHCNSPLNLILDVPSNNVIDRQQCKKVKRVLGIMKNRGQLAAVRMCGLVSTYIPSLAKDLSLLQQDLGMPIAIFPSNQNYMATAITTEAMRVGVDFITTHFNGGTDQTFTPLEEISLAREVLFSSLTPTNNELLCKFSFLPSLAQTYSRVIGETISPMKPIIGEDIFKYESGIHADGIAKNHTTYEPYAPELVGQQRELLLGKHSGVKSLRSKLEEWKLSIAEQNIPLILEKIKEKSINIPGNISEQEMISLLSNLDHRKRAVGADLDVYR